MYSASDSAAGQESGGPALVHPLGISGARRSYVLAAVLAIAASPTTLVAMILLLSAVSDNVVTPFAGPIIGLTVTAYAERRFRADAWAYVPRGRQDLGRCDPAGLALAAEVTMFSVLGAALWVFVSRAPSIASGAAAAGAGAIAAGMLVLVIHMVWDASARPVHRSSRAPVAMSATFRAVSLVLMVWSYAAVAGGGSSLAVTSTAGLVVLGACAVWTAIRCIPARVACLPPGAFSS